jgi:hypothetical protein
MDSPKATDVPKPRKVEANDIAEELWILDEPVESIESGSGMSGSPLIPVSPIHVQIALHMPTLLRLLSAVRDGPTLGQAGCRCLI